MVYLILTTLLHPWLIQRFSREKIRLDWLSIGVILTLIPLKIFMYAFLADSFTYFIFAWMTVFLQTAVLFRVFSSRNLELSFFLMLCNALFYYISSGILMLLSGEVSFVDVINLGLIGRNNPFQVGLTIILLILLGVFRNRIPLEFRWGEAGRQGYQSIFFILVLNLIILIMYNVPIPEGGKLILFVVLNLAVMTFYIRNRNLWSESLRDKEVILERDKVIGELSSYVETIEGLSDRFQEFRHDMRNMMVGMGMDEGRIERTIEEVEQDLLSQSDYGNILALRQIHYPALKSLLYYYVMKAKDSNVGVTLNVVGEVSPKTWSEVVFSRVLGVLFENALESASNSEEKILDIFVEDSPSALTITIGNSYPGEIGDIDTLFEKGYTTKVGDGGMGLYGLKKLLAANPEYRLNTLIEGDLFIQDLMINK
jgi:two-component system, LytTR family, sensor histidine kinase AgrC